MKIIFDIETVGLNLEQLEQFKPAFEASKVLKDPEKIKADIATKEKEWLDKAALQAYTGKILAIGYLSNKFKISHGEDEASLLEEFWSIFREYYEMIGHYIKGFDVPYIIRRSYINKVKVPAVMNGRYLIPKFVDTMEVWSLGTRDTISLDNLSKALGVGKKNGHGEDFANLYYNEETRKQAFEYLENDLRITKACAGRLGVI